MNRKPTQKNGECMLVAISVLSDFPYEGIRKLSKIKTGMPWSNLPTTDYWKEVNRLRGILNIKSSIPTQTQWERTAGSVEALPTLVGSGSIGLRRKRGKLCHIVAFKNEKIYNSYSGIWVSPKKFIKDNRYEVVGVWKENN